MTSKVEKTWIPFYRHLRAVTALNCHVIEIKEEPDIEVEVTIDDSAEGTVDKSRKPWLEKYQKSNQF